MALIQYPLGHWTVELTDEQLAAGKAAAVAKGATHYSVWAALRDAGVPVRDPETGRTTASLAATALQTMQTVGPL